jgi:hypothetical protein
VQFAACAVCICICIMKTVWHYDKQRKGCILFLSAPQQ